MKELACSLVFIGFIMIISATWWQAGRESASNGFRREAVLKGYAEYVADEDGKSVWQWKEIDTQ